MYLDLKNMSRECSRKTNDFLIKSRVREEKMYFDSTKEYLAYRMILASVTHERFQGLNRMDNNIKGENDEVNFYLLNKEVDLYNSKGFDDIVDLFNSRDREAQIKELCIKFNESYVDYNEDNSYEEAYCEEYKNNRKNLALRLIIKLLLEDNKLELDANNLKDMIILEINKVKIDGLPGLERIAQWF